MSVSFDWDVTEETDVQGRPDIRTPPPDRKRRGLRRVIVAIVLLVLVGIPIGAWAANRLKAVERAEAKLRAAVELELKTIYEGDVELFRGRQDLADPEWQEQQVARYFSAEVAQIGPVPGLTPADKPLEVKEIHFFGDTGRAELVRWFEGNSDNITGVLAFHLTWFYRQDDDGTWYHVAPSNDYWGVPYSWHGSRLSIRGTEVESRAIDAVADELARLVSRACQWLRCPEGERFNLNFSDSLDPQVQATWWILPALYLTGIPEDAAARAAWGQALKEWVVEASAEVQVNDASLRERLIYRQLVESLQAELGLTEPRFPDVELLAAALRDDTQHPLWGLWQAKPDANDAEQTRLLEAEVAALLVFVRDQVGARDMFRLLPALQGYARLSDALADLYGLERDSFSTAWLVFLSNLTGVFGAYNVSVGV